MQKSAIIYARVSTSRQADEGISIESQVEQGKAKAAELGLRVVKIFRDEGVSGRTAKRPAFQDAINYCAAFEVDHFIVWNTSRFARNKLDAASFKKLLRGSGTQVTYCAANIDTETDEGWFSESIFEIMDEHYSRVVSRDTRRSMMKNARDGYWNGGHVPFGYKAVPDEKDSKRKRLAIVDHEAVIVREMFRLYLGGLGAKTISMDLNARGHTRRGTSWTKASVAAVIKNWVYAGFIVFNRVDHHGTERPESEWIMTKSHAPIVTEDEFQRARELLQERAPVIGTGSPHSNFVFTGMLRCGECGAAMQTESATGRSQIYHYYNCSRAQKGGGCSNRRIKAGDFDDWMIDSILAKVLTPQQIGDVLQELLELQSGWAADQNLRRDAVVKEMRDITNRRRKIYEVLELHGKDAPNLGDLTHRLREFNVKLKALEEQLVAIDNEPIPSIEIEEEEIVTATNLLANTVRGTTDPKKLRQLMSSFIERILLNTADLQVEYRPDRIINEKRREHMVHGVKSWLPDLGSNQGPTD